MNAAMTDSAETVEVAAAKAGTRWRTIAIGLLIVGAGQVVNGVMNFAQLRQGPPMVCVAAINDPALSKKAVEQRLNQ